MSEKPDIYDIAETAERVRDALRRMQTGTTPGQRNGRGRKMDVLREVKDDIAEVMRLGWSAQQIADAIADNDVFKILPKSITQLMNSSSISSITPPEKSRRSPRKRHPTSDIEDIKKVDGHHGSSSRVAHDASRSSASKPNDKWSGPKPDRD